ASTMAQTTVDYIEKWTPSGQFAFWTVYEGQTTSQPAIAPNKQTAKHKSNRCWLQGKLEETLNHPTEIDQSALQNTVKGETVLTSPFPGETEEDIDLSGVPTEAINAPIAYLHTTLQRLKLKKPAYFYDKVGTQWRSRCRVQWLDEILIETEALGQTKKEGKTQASLKAIVQLENHVIEDLED
ncbi:MAG: exoribonuclease II, partial [Crocosphaera sp.]